MKITNKDIIWSYSSQIFQMGASLFILPIILKKLSSDEVGIWYIFMSFSAMINLLDFGLSPTFSRNISYIFSGAKNLSAEGISSEISKEIDYFLLKNTINSVKKIYMYISLIVIIIFGTLGSIYIKSLIRGNENLNLNVIMYAWIIYIFSLAFNFYYYYFTPMLLGRSLIKESHKTIVFTKMGYLGISYILIQFNYGLLGIAVANLVSSFINRVFSYKYFYDKKIKKKLEKIKRDKKEEKKITKIILKNSSKLGAVSIGAFLINKSSLLITSKYVDLKMIANYGITLQVISLLTTISSVLFNTYLPIINYLRIHSKKIEIKEIFSKVICINYFIYLSGSLFLLNFGNKILEILKSNTLLLDNKYLILLLSIYFLEMNHSIAATLITTKNTVPFLKPALISGIMIVILILLSLNFTNLGLYGVILSQGLVQLAYNNWKWPVEVSKDLDINYLKILKNGFNLILYRRKNGE